MANIKLFTVMTMMALAFIVVLATFTGQTTAAELSERAGRSGVPAKCHDCPCFRKLCKDCPACKQPPVVLEVVEERQPVDPRPVRGGGGGGHQSICDNCSCNEYVCKKSCPQCQHHGLEQLVERKPESSICDNCSCSEYVCKKSCPQCIPHEGLLQEE